MDLAISELNSAAGKLVDARVGEMKFRSSLATRLWKKRKADGGALISWQNQTVRQDMQSFTAGSTWNAGSGSGSDLSTELQLAWFHFVNIVRLSNVELLMLKKAPRKVFDRVESQIAWNFEACEYGLAHDIFWDGSAVAITLPDATAGTRTPFPGLLKIGTPDVIYAGHTPSLALSPAATAKMWHQPRVFDMTSTITPSHGDASGFPGGVPSYGDLSDKDSPFYLMKTVDRFITWGMKQGYPITYVPSDESTYNAFSDIYLAKQVDMSKGKEGELGKTSFMYKGVEIDYEPMLDADQGHSVGRMFGIPEDLLDLIPLSGAELAFNSFLEVTPRATDAIIADHLLSCALKMKIRRALCHCYNIPRG